MALNFQNLGTAVLDTDADLTEADRALALVHIP